MQLYVILAAAALVVLLLCCGIAVCIVVRRRRSEQRGKIGPQDGRPRLGLYAEREERLSKGPDRRSVGPVGAGLLRPGRATLMALPELVRRNSLP